MKTKLKISLLLFGVVLFSGCTLTGNKINNVEDRQAPVENEIIQDEGVINTNDQNIVNVENNEIEDKNIKKDRVYFEIRELGIKILINESIKNDLMYFYKEMEDGGKLVSLSSKSITSMDQLCDGKDYSSPFFNIVRVEGAPNDLDKERTIYEFKDFFIGFGAPNARCSPSDNTMDAIKNINDNIYLYPGCKNCIFEI